LAFPRFTTRFSTFDPGKEKGKELYHVELEHNGGHEPAFSAKASVAYKSGLAIEFEIASANKLLRPRQLANPTLSGSWVEPNIYP
jgi:hypothetical protein